MLRERQGVVDMKGEKRVLNRRGSWTDLTGDESQICLFGGCLLMTYVPFEPRLRVNTPLCKDVH